MVVVAVLVLLLTKSKPWALGVLLGGLAHNVTDTSDTVGTMLLWPFWNENISTGIWAYAAEVGRYDDAGAYYSSLGVVMDALWLVIALAHFEVFRERYFWNTIVRGRTRKPGTGSASTSQSAQWSPSTAPGCSTASPA